MTDILNIRYKAPSGLRLLNNVAQTICLKGVFRASASVSPLALTIILSVRKFLSVMAGQS